MRWSVVVVIFALLLSAGGWLLYSHQSRVIVLKEPPASLAKWYKPQNKRQVWLHTMFKLRREMLAVGIYAKAQDGESVQKWLAKLSKDYRKIADMAPEWKGRLDLLVMAELQNSADDNRFDDIAKQLTELSENCTACHGEYRAVTAMTYRAPDFSQLKINGSTPLKTHMRTLSEQVNRINIAAIDGKTDAALDAFADLTGSMNRLGGICADCHKTDPQTYPDAKMSEAMATLGQSLRGDSLNDKGQALGAVAVMACATCHGTHRLSYDAKQLFNGKMGLRDLLRHSF